MDTKSQRSGLAAGILPFPRARRRFRMKMGAARDQQLLLDMVLNNMSQGVLMFDSESRLVFCNQRYIEMYGLSPESAKPGCTLRDLLDHRIAVRSISDDAALAMLVRDSITKPYQLDGHQIVVDISIGISVAPIDATEPDQLLKNADMALYGAKADGRGTYRFFEPEMDARMKARRALEMDLRNALVNEEFELYYQPLVNLQSNEISAFEALLRWNHPTRGMIPPAEVIPVAEETGLIIPLGEWVLRKACEETANWPDDVKVAVNLSPAQLKSRNLVQTVMSALAASGMAANRLQLEVTETVLMQNTFATLATLH